MNSRKTIRDKIITDEGNSKNVDSESKLIVYNRKEEAEEEKEKEKAESQENEEEEKKKEKDLIIQDENFDNILKKLKTEPDHNIFDPKFIDTYEGNLKDELLLKMIKEKYNNPDQEEELILIENKLNIIKIFIDLRTIFENEIALFSFSKMLDLFILYKNENENNFQTLMKNFDNLCKRIKMNLNNELFTERFFNNLEPIYIKFIIRFLMIKIFFDKNEKNGG